MDFNPGIFKDCLENDFKRSKSTCDITTYRIHALRQSVLKKYVNGQNSVLHDMAMTDFVALNNQVSEFRLNSDFVNGSIFRTWKTLLNDVFHSGSLQSCSLTLSRCIDFGKCGPGASIGTETTSFLEKMFASQLTSTSKSLLTFYRQVIEGSRWSEAELIRTGLYGDALVAGSKLSSVPKDSTKNRTICIEPTLNMFYQLGAKFQIESVLRSRMSLDIRTQAEVNKELARTSSVNGSHATIDLKNASDSISLELCWALLPSDVMSVLMQIRSDCTDVDGVTTELAMMSTMGNGFTFPLMTLLFATLIKAITINEGGSFINGVDWGVFGDDLIIRSELADTLVSCLSQSGFTVNASKSFLTGPFRESCGGDFYRGHDVRGVYFKELHNAAQIYSAFNRLHFWSIRNNVSLNDTLVYLKGLVDFRPVPGHAAVHEGFIVTSSQLTSPKKDRNGAIYYRSAGYKSRFKLKVERFDTNYPGCVIAFLGGYVSDNKVLCRSDMIPSVVKKKTPCWDFLTHPGLTRRVLDLSWTVLLNTER